jgi:hypothetical protein
VESNLARRMAPTVQVRMPIAASAKSAPTMLPTEYAWPSMNVRYVTGMLVAAVRKAKVVAASGLSGADGFEPDTNLDGERESLKEVFTEEGQSERKCRVWQDDEAQLEEATNNSVGEVERPRPQASSDHRKEGASEQARDKCAGSPGEADGACGGVEVCADAAEEVGQNEGAAGREEPQQYEDHFAAAHSNESTSRWNCTKLSPARRRSGPGAGMKRKIEAGRKTIVPIRIVAGILGSRNTNSPAVAERRPVPLNTARFIHLLSGFLCWFGVMLESQPPRAELERPAATAPMTRAI